MKPMWKRCILFGFAIITFAAWASAHADTAIVPDDHATVQAAVTAVEGTTDAMVTINSSAIFDETVTITQSITIQAGTGFAPTIRGSVADTRTIVFNPNSATPVSFTLSGLTLLPEAGAGAQNNTVLLVQNDGTAETTVRIENVTIDDPEDRGPQGISIRSDFTNAAANAVDIIDTAISLGGAPDMGTTAIFMGELGTLTISGAAIDMILSSSDAFDIRGSVGTITFTLAESTVNVTAPNGSYSAEVGRLSDDVVATVRNNVFNLIDNSQGHVSGFILGWGSQQLILDANLVYGFGPEPEGILSAFPRSGDTTTLVATNNIIVDTQSGISFNPQSGSPGGIVQATIVNNTFYNQADGILGLYAGNPGTTINAMVANNIFSNCGDTALLGTVDSGSALDATCDYNLYDNNVTDVSNVVKGANSITGDPLFTDVAAGIFIPQSGSPAIDSGNNSAPNLPAMDAAGDDRVQDGDGDGTAVVDMGALESAASNSGSGGGSGGGGGGGCFIGTVLKQDRKNVFGDM